MKKINIGYGYCNNCKKWKILDYCGCDIHIKPICYDCAIDLHPLSDFDVIFVFDLSTIDPIITVNREEKEK